MLLGVVNVDVAPKIGDADPQAELLVQVLDEAVEEMPGFLIAAMDERVMAIDDLDVGSVVGQGGEMWIVEPHVGTGRAYVGEELTWMAPVQVTHRGAQHHDVAGGLEVSKDQFAHVEVRTLALFFD